MAAARQGDRAGADARRCDLAAAACPTSSIRSSGKDDKAEQTAALRSAPGRKACPDIGAAATPNDSDLAYAKAAAAAVLGRPEKNASQPWENPGTGARGTVTPIADAYTQDGFHLPRLPRELYPRRRGILAAGRRLPHPSGQVDRAEVAAAETQSEVLAGRVA